MSKTINININEAFALALQHHQAGNLRNAGTLYRQIIQASPCHSDALHLLGVISYQTHNYDMAVEYIKKAIEANSMVFAYHNNLGNAYLAQKNLDKALACYKCALDLKSDYAEAHNNMGNALYEIGDMQEAEDHYKKALEINPEFLDSYTNLGNMALARGEGDTAVTYYAEALKLQPQNHEVLNNLGNAMRQKGLDDEAIKYYTRAIQFSPNYADAHNNLGNTYKDKGDFHSAEKCYKEALRIKPDFAEALNNMGTVKEDMDEAISFYLKAIELAPDFMEVYNNLGYTFTNKGMFAEAIKYYEKALALKPDYAEAHFGLGLLQLLIKNFKQGWKEFEWRFRLEDRARRVSLPVLPQPRWEGGSIKGKTIYVYSEQGFGDTIQFVRYLPLLHAKGAQVLFKPQAELQELFVQNDLKATIINSDAKPDLINFDIHVPLLSIPHVLRTNFNNIPQRTKYLNADKEKAASFHQEYYGNDKFKIGLCWQGRPTHLNDKDRSLTLSSFIRFAEIPEVQLYSLQKGKRAEQLTVLPEKTKITDLGPALNDFSDTAAAIEGLDLVITVDTSVAHLSGALGKPTWILLPFTPDWRWFMDAEDSPWYESVRLFRQKRHGRWDEVLDSIWSSLQGIAR